MAKLVAEESRQSYQERRQHGTILANCDVLVFGNRIEDVEDCLNEILELVRRFDEANGTDHVPNQVKKGVESL